MAAIIEDFAIELGMFTSIPSINDVASALSGYRTSLLEQEADSTRRHLAHSPRQ